MRRPKCNSQYDDSRGYNNRQLGDLLVKHGFAESREEFLNLAKNKKLLTKYSIKAETLEGYLFPETYSLPVDYSLEQVVEVFLKKMQQVLKEEVRTELSGVKLHEKMILASIVEREAQRKEERAVIAGVFQNRLDQSIPLESCATVQYLFEKPKNDFFTGTWRRVTLQYLYLFRTATRPNFKSRSGCA